MQADLHLILLDPNLGNPAIITKGKRKENLSFKSIISVNKTDDVDKVRNLLSSIRLIPIFASNGRTKRREKSKSKINTSRATVIRGKPVKCIITLIKPFESDFSNYIDLDNYIKKHIITGKLYQVNLEFKINKEIIKYLKNENFVMFDINYAKDLTNFHSVVISKNKWETFNFIQATDLHVADRNDNIYEIVKNWLSGFRTKDFADFAKFSLDSFSFLKNSILSFFGKKTDKDDIRVEPLRRRLINPNNNLRKFIRLVNNKVFQKELDFVIFTGDLIDYSTLSNLPADFKNFSNFEYENTNWKVFKEILLNYPQKKRRGMIRGEEIMCPIFTIPGNHDFRPFHYDLRWGNLYKKIGLNANEAIALNDALAAHPIGSITRNYMSLKGYLLNFNFKLDYSLHLGKFRFIFLNSGPDSFKSLRDFISGHPSATGISNRQVKYLEYLINNNKDNLNNFLFLHGPPINPQKNLSIFDRFILNKLTEKHFRKLDDFKESIKKVTQRIDLKFNIKYGTISSNWEKLLDFCKNYCVITFCGHTHEFKEFRLGDPEGVKSKVLKAPPFVLKKIENPAAIYYDIYSEINQDSKSIKKNAPYLVQTPALGLGGYHHPKLAGAYREVRVKGGKLESFKVNFIKRI